MLLDDVVRELDQMLDGRAKHARGGARAAMVDRLAGLDRRLLDAARAGLPPAESERLRAQADGGPGPFPRPDDQRGVAQRD